MRYPKISLYIIFMIYFSAISTYSADDDLSFNTIKKHLDTALEVASTAAGTQLPGGHMATALSAIPAATTQYLRTDTYTKMQSLTIEALDHPEKFEECYNLINRYQAINSALTGDPTRWIEIVDNNRKKNQSSGTPKSPSQTDDDDEQENMRYQFKHFNSTLDKLNSRLNLLQSTAAAHISSMESQLQSLNLMHSTLDSGKKILTTFNIDQDIQNLKNKSYRLNQLLKIVEKNRAEIIRKISSATTRKHNCSSDADSTFVKTAFQECQAALSELRTSEAEAELISQYAIDEYNNIIEKITAINQKRNNYNTECRKTLTSIQQLTANIHSALNAIENEATSENSAIGSELTVLKNEIADSSAYYTNLFPTSSSFYSQYNSRLTAVKTRLSNVYRNILYKIQSIRNKLSANGKFAADALQPYSPSLADINPEMIKKLTAQISNILQEAENLMASNSALQNGCTPEIPDSPPADDSTSNDYTNDKNHNTDSDTAQQPQDSTPVTDNNNQMILVFGGLTIAGPTSITVGEGLTLIACDASGRPYPSDGSFKWNNYGNDLLSLGDHSNAVSGVGFKPGKVMVQLNHEGMYAYIDIEIKEADNQPDSEDKAQDNNEQSIFTSKGGDQNQDATDTSTNSGGADLCTSCDDDTSADNQKFNFISPKCGEIMEKLVNAIRLGNINLALHLRNLAIAESCNINVQAANNYINQLIHNQQLVQHQHQQTSRNSQNLLILQNIINSLNHIKSTSGDHHKPSNHHHHDADSDTKSYNYDKLRNYGNALSGGSW